MKSDIMLLHATKINEMIKNSEHLAEVLKKIKLMEDSDSDMNAFVQNRVNDLLSNINRVNDRLIKNKDKEIPNVIIQMKDLFFDKE